MSGQAEYSERMVRACRHLWIARSEIDGAIIELNGDWPGFVNELAHVYVTLEDMVEHVKDSDQ